MLQFWLFSFVDVLAALFLCYIFHVFFLFNFYLLHAWLEYI